MVKGLPSLAYSLNKQHWQAQGHKKQMLNQIAKNSSTGSLVFIDISVVTRIDRDKGSVYFHSLSTNGIGGLL